MKKDTQKVQEYLKLRQGYYRGRLNKKDTIKMWAIEDELGMSNNEICNLLKMVFPWNFK